MKKIDLSIGIDYHTQINNRRDPYGACNVTASIMFLKVNRIPYTNPTTEQDEDYLMWRMRQPSAYLKLEELTPWFVRKGSAPVTDWSDQAQIERRYLCPPEQVFAVLAWGVNDLAGASVCRLRLDLNLYEFLFELARGRAMVSGGKYTASGHFVTTVGLITDQDDIGEARTPADIRPEYLTHIINDDPYGNYLTGYRDHAGNSVEIPSERWLDVAAGYRHPAYWAAGKPQHRLYAITRV